MRMMMTTTATTRCSPPIPNNTTKEEDTAAPPPNQELINALFPLHQSCTEQQLQSLSLSSSCSSSSFEDYFYIGSIAISDGSSKSSTVIHGRGLIATKDIDVGDILFIIPPTISASIQQVIRLYQNSSSSSSSSNNDNNNNNNSKSNNNAKRLEEIAETVLLKEMKRAIRRKLPQADSFLLLQSSHHSTNHDEDNDDNDNGKQDHPLLDQYTASDSLMNTLLGRRKDIEQTCLQKQDTDSAGGVDNNNSRNYDDDYLRGIIRQNAFGPDFHHYERIEKEIAVNGQHHSPSSPSSSSAYYNRILDLYPLAAMINHSCTTNATRIFSSSCCMAVPKLMKNSSQQQQQQSYMIATATKQILKGDEIVWSYVPPTIDYLTRQKHIQHNYGFTCTCQRCTMDQEFYSQSSSLLNLPLCTVMNDYSTLSLVEWKNLIQSLDDWYANSLTKGIVSYSTVQSIRLGYTSLYIAYFNAMLIEVQRLQHHHKDLPVEVVDRTVVSQLHRSILQQATHLHFCFLSIHPASTEHLSILYLCYDLVSSKDASNDPKKAMFWFEQLKHTHMLRYSKEVVPVFGNGPSRRMDQSQRQQIRLKNLLQHTKLVLRNPDGWHKTKFKFL
jgi:hypothetical protein